MGGIDDGEFVAATAQQPTQNRRGRNYDHRLAAERLIRRLRLPVNLSRTGS